KLNVRASKSRNYLLAPLDILTSLRHVPAFRRMIGNITHVADLVCELELLSSVRKVRSALSLQTFAFGFGQRQVVGELADVVCDSLSKTFPDLLEGNSCVFDRVM